MFKLSAVLAVSLLITACATNHTPNIDSGGTPQTSDTVVITSPQAVYEPAPNKLILAGDNAANVNNFTDAMSLYKKASEDRDPVISASAMNRIGVLYECACGVRRDYVQAFQWYKKSAVLGNPYAQAHLGSCYIYGKGTDENAEEAVYWNLKAAESGVVMAMDQIAFQYLSGNGVQRDLNEAKRWYKKSAVLGDVRGQQQLGWLFVNTEPVDYQQGMLWTKKAADQNDPVAQNVLGYIYENGLGIPNDYTEAAHWYQLSADAGIAASQYHLGLLYDQGLGVTRDNKLALTLMRKAAASGESRAMQWLYNKSQKIQ
jgi:uncharacterized protein